jgi:ubiquinone/menaquinone biosynthesis methyltransferase
VSIETGRLSADGVRSMFDGIAPVYDAMNRAPTGGLDGRWRRLAAQAVVKPDATVLDACCGTRGLALAARAEGARVTGVDFSQQMLAVARRKSSKIDWVEADLLDLPFAAGSFDAATVGFGIRIVADVGRALRELRQVLRCGGRVAILDLVRSAGPLSLFFRVWFDRLVPLAGKGLPGGVAYAYLPASVRRFSSPPELKAELQSAGFGPVAHRLLGGGIVVLIVGEAA